MTRRAICHVSIALAVLAAGAGTLTWAASADDARLGIVLAARLPRTPVTAIDCGKIDGLCEVQAGESLFYTDKAGRFLVIGRVYDMDTRQDLTAARLLELSPEILVGGAAGLGAGDESRSADGRQVSATTKPHVPRASPRQTVALAGLPEKGAIRWGAGPQTVTVFSDFRCGYCRQLHRTLAEMKVSVIERPISVLGTRPISDAVICASDRAEAVAKAYNQESIVAAGECDTRGLDANEAFARENGFTGTPVIVRSDGAVVHGYRPRAFLETWLKETR
ncbi:DsbC family protein [Sphingobium sp.]|uniref:DsbC family protein n=1 Tax=Sphingobium sp. TaxID=1912891 RepID=UPI002C15D407|nr:DsbC family protein [Sphingobium sp.]HUD94865.1 DsbC family protein [Sphingobium sp.]